MCVKLIYVTRYKYAVKNDTHMYIQYNTYKHMKQEELGYYNKRSEI